MNLKDNLPRIIKSLNKPIKDIAEEIGISPNTLSNIKNGKVEPNGETLNKILTYLKNHGIDEKEIYKEEPVIPNIRIRTNKELSGFEKSLLKEDLTDFANVLSDSEMLKYLPCWVIVIVWLSSPAMIFTLPVLDASPLFSSTEIERFVFPVPDVCESIIQPSELDAVQEDIVLTTTF